MRSEEQFSAFVLQHLKKLLKGNDLSIEAGKNILTDVTCIYENGRFELIHGFSQTDIVIFKEQRFDIKKFDGGIVKFYNDSEIKKGIFSIPLVVLELKTGELTTDGIRSRDFVADRIRTLFPFSAYYFIAENTTKEEKTLLRQGKSFTNYFLSKSQVNGEYLNKIFENYIDPHIKNLKTQLKIIDS